MEATSTLADALLNDLDDLSDIEEVKEDEGETDELGNEPDDGVMYENTSAVSAHDNDHCVKSSKKRFLDDEKLVGHLEKIRQYLESKPASSKEEQQEEYDLIVQSNRLLTRLSEELDSAHSELTSSYKPKFPELEELLPDPMQYIKAVRVIGNEMDLTKVTDDMSEFLNSNQIITISVSGSTTSGRPLSDDEMNRVSSAASYVEQILKVQKQLVSFVESRMEGLAPSVSALIGPSLAAQLLGLAGGLAELSKIPACNLQVLGQARYNKRQALSSRSASSIPHAGILATSEWVTQNKHYHLAQQQDLQRKALKALASKVALAARCDFVNVDTGRPRSAEAGLKFREELRSKIERWKQDPEKAPVLKALPKPDLSIKKRRGGRRMRQLKERFEETALMKQANTRAFNAQAGEYGDDAMGLTLGLLDTGAETAGASGIRKVNEKRKMRLANTKGSRKRAAQMAAKASNTNGLASSIVFTPVQGMELVNPDANKERVREANRKWFSEHAGFQSAIPKNNS